MMAEVLGVNQFWPSSGPLHVDAPRYAKTSGNGAINVQTGQRCLMTGNHGVYPVDNPHGDNDVIQPKSIADAATRLRDIAGRLGVAQSSDAAFLRLLADNLQSSD